MPRWTIKCYCNASGNDLVDKEFSSQSVPVRQEFRAVLNGLRDRPRSEWIRPAGFDQLSGKYKKLGKLRFKVANVQHRPLGFFPGGETFVLLIWATERDGKYDPPDVRDTALKRMAAVEQDDERVYVISDRLADDLATDEASRNSFVGAQLRTFLTYQIRTLRTQHGLSQEDLAKALNTSQSTIARLENRDYGKFTLTTLLELARAFDVALIVEFAEYPDFLLRTRNMSERALARKKFSRQSLDFLCKDQQAEAYLASRPSSRRSGG